MKLQHFVIIRFSVYFKNHNSIRVSHPHALSFLYSKKRMENRFYYMENFCLPSLAQQSCKDFKVILLISNLMPGEYRVRLERIIANYSFIILHVWRHDTSDVLAHNDWLACYLDSSATHLALTRMDDDDAVSPHLIAQIQSRYLAHIKDTLDFLVINIRYGLVLKHSRDKRTSCIVECKFPYNSCSVGVTIIISRAVNLNIFAFNHNYIHEEFIAQMPELIVQSLSLVITQNMYIYNDHDYNILGYRGRNLFFKKLDYDVLEKQLSSGNISSLFEIKTPLHLIANKLICCIHVMSFGVLRKIQKLVRACWR